MRILWIFPEKKRCGISIYSIDYIKELRGKCEVITADPDDWSTNKDTLLNKIYNADLVHIQYETSFFVKNRKDHFKAIISRIRKPVIVSLHEIYEEFPQVYPRSKISGSTLLLPVKRMIYDVRHPLQTAYIRHCGLNFGADLILVHQFFQKEILMRKDIKSEHIEVLDHPIKKKAHVPQFLWKAGQTIKLGSTGFINPGYDYSLLFKVLEKLEVNWKFTWIGGLRSDEHKNLLSDLTDMIIGRKWQDRFIITGWVSEEEQDKLLADIDIYCALFKYRSSSGTLSKAIGALKPIIGTEIPLTQERGGLCGQKCASLMTMKSDPETIKNGICKVLSDNKFREGLFSEMQNYANKVNLPNMATKMISIYRRFL